MHHTKFRFDQEPVIYNCAYNDQDQKFGGAFRESMIGEAPNVLKRIDGLFGYVWSESEGEQIDSIEYGAIQGYIQGKEDDLIKDLSEVSEDIPSLDLSLDIAVLVEYTNKSNEPNYCYRSEIRGNTKSNLFTFRLAKASNSTDKKYSFTSIVGKGYSKGESQYFLAKITTDKVSNRYYCINAGNNEKDLMSINEKGYEGLEDIESTSPCAKLAEDYEFTNDKFQFTIEDLVCKKEDISEGNTKLDPDVPIYLNYNQ